MPFTDVPRLLGAARNGSGKLDRSLACPEGYRALNAGPLFLFAIYGEGGHVVGPQQLRHQGARERGGEGAARPGAPGGCEDVEEGQVHAR